MFIYNAVLAYNAWIWGIPILIILIGGGLYLSFVTGFVQVRHFPDVLKSTVGGMFNKEEMKEETGKHHGTISSFQAVSAALAAVLGTGNIVGVGTAIAAGGPGAIFWMWIVGFVAMALKYSEACVSIAVREKKPEGGYKGGANYYLSKINKPLGFAWSIAMIYSLITAAGVHTGSVVTACESLGIPRLVATIVVCIIIALIIFGGIQALVQITERLVPFMAAIYIIGGLAVVVLNIGNLIPAIVSIFKGAFTGTAAIGGFAGATISAAIRNVVFTLLTPVTDSPLSHTPSHPRQTRLNRVCGVSSKYSSIRSLFVHSQPSLSSAQVFGRQVKLVPHLRSQPSLLH